MWQMVGNTRGTAAISLETINQGHNEAKTISGFNCAAGGGNLLDPLVYEMKEEMRGEALMRTLYCLCWGMQPL